MTSAKDRAPMTDSASGGRGEASSRGRIARAPGWRRIVKKWKSQHGTGINSVCTNAWHVLLHVLLYCGSTWWVGGWMGEWVRDYGWLTCFAVLFSGPMLLSLLDHGALRTNL